MAKIQILDSETIDKIAAGEVVERPLSVVKELVENAMDAGASSITVEIKEGGISFIRVTDNGSGIEASQIQTAFLRHATSKISKAEDLERVLSLGFRGEALSSICAVSKVELVTKTKDNLTGIRYVCEGGIEKECQEIGAPDGTTVMVRNLFYNTPVRRKFLKQPQTEGGYVIDLMEHMALSRPEIAFKLVVNNQIKFHTSGNGNLKEVIYRIYGRDVTENLVPIESNRSGMRLSGYLGKPLLNRSNRNFETYFINNRYVKSSALYKAIEDGYSQYLMQHKFPFVVLHINMDASMVDVNVHPTKMDVRFADNKLIYEWISTAIEETLAKKEMIPGVAPEAKMPVAPVTPVISGASVSADTSGVDVPPENPAGEMSSEDTTVNVSHEGTAVNQSPENLTVNELAQDLSEKEQIKNAQPQERMVPPIRIKVPEPFETKRSQEFYVKEDVPDFIKESTQMELFEEKMLTRESREQYRILGQIFDTYWLIAFSDKLFIVDQHAAHEKVKYERLIREYREKTISSQSLNPPIVLTLSAKEEEVYLNHSQIFSDLGFEVSEFGGREYALRAVPTDLYGLGEKEMFITVLDELISGPVYKNLTLVEEKLASMACKAAVKGNHSFSQREMEALIDELLLLENPYNCPHGRPTIISMSKYEIEKKFKRIV